MSKASELRSKSGAPGPASTPAPSKPAVHAHPDDSHKNPGDKGHDTLRGGQVTGSAGKPPIGVRPKV